MIINGIPASAASIIAKVTRDKFITKLSKKFKNIIIITNQQCIGKGLVSYKQVCELHNKMLNELNLNIDTPIFICPHTIKDDCKCRKPKPGLFLEAINDFNLDKKIELFSIAKGKKRNEGNETFYTK